MKSSPAPGVKTNVIRSKIKPIRVLVVEDTVVFCELLVSILQSDPDLQVVGVAHNGLEAVRLARRLQPDVITMDVYMPKMNGLEATRQIMTENPRPIVMISGGVDKNEHKLTFNALQAGALSVMGKPTMYDSPEAYENLKSQIKLMSEVKVVRHWNRVSKRPKHQPVKKPLTPKQNGVSKIQVVAIAASTGGPGILAEILDKLPADFSAPILIVQHITPGFGQGFTSWLNQQTSLEVQLAYQAQEIKAGQILVAPDGHHMGISDRGLITLSKEAPLYGLRPAANYLFKSVARVYGATAIGVILSGMGSDGAEGLQMMREFGAHTIAQDEATCVVFGMPAVAIKLGAAEQILPTNKIAATIISLM